MVKVLHSVLSMAPGGLENGVANLLRHHANEYNVQVLCLRELGAVGDQLNHEVPGRILFDGNSNPSLSVAIKKTKDAIETFKPDILHTHGWTTMLSGFIAAKLSNHSVKIVNGEHGVLYFENWHRRVMQRWLMNQIDLNLSVSESLAKEVQTALNVSSEKFKTIINGVNTQQFMPDAEQGDKLRKELNIPDNSIVLLAVGRMVAVKNYPFLIDVFQRLKKDCPLCHLVFCGEGEQRSELEFYAEKKNLLSHITFLGYRSDVANIMRLANIFIQTSVREGLPNTVLEALATGVPVVASNVGGTHEVLDHASDGFLFESENAEQLYNVLSELIRDPARRYQMGEAGRYKIMQRFSIHAMVRAYENTYQSLIVSR